MCCLVGLVCVVFILIYFWNLCGVLLCWCSGDWCMLVGSDMEILLW